MPVNELSGEYNYWMVIDRAPNNKHGQAMWNCKCKCGTEAVVAGFQLSTNTSKSCGCFSIEKSSQMHKKHGMCGTRTYNIWQAMMRRCNEEKFVGYSDYGGRGIIVCEKWHKFEGFFEDMGECPKKLSIDRIDPNKNYEKENCRWLSMKEQMNNKRNTLFLEYKGERKSLNEWASILGITRSCLYKRIYEFGLSVEEAFTESTDRSVGKSLIKSPVPKKEQKEILITYNMETKTLSEWSKIYNIPKHTIKARIRSNKNIVNESIFKPVEKKGRFLTIGDKTENLSYWANQAGISLTTIIKRLNNGWSPEKAVEPRQDRIALRNNRSN